MAEKDTRSLVQKMKDRNKDLDAAIDAQTAPQPPVEAEKRLKDSQTTDKNNTGYF